MRSSIWFGLSLVAMLLGAAVHLVSCTREGESGGSPDRASVIASIAAPGPALPMTWVQAGEPPTLRHRGLARLLSSPVGSREPPGFIDGVLAGARVVIVADMHDVPTVRTTFADVVELCCSGTRSAAGLAVALEALPRVRQAEVDAAMRAGDLEPVLARIRAAWPWPVEEYERIIRLAAQRRIQVLCCGPTEDTIAPQVGVPDAERRGVPTALTPREIAAGTATFVSVARAWLSSSPGNRVLGLIGAAHVIGAASVLTAGGRDMMDTLAVVPLERSWESAVWLRLGAEAAEQWVEVLPGVWRPPLPRDLTALVESGVWSRSKLAQERFTPGDDWFVGESRRIATELHGLSMEAVVARVRSILDGEVQSAEAGLRVLSIVGETSPGGRSLLLSASEDPRLRERALYYLGFVWSEDPEQREMLEAILRGPRATARERLLTALCLGRMLASPDLVLPELVQQLEQGVTGIDAGRIMWNLFHYGQRMGPFLDRLSLVEASLTKKGPAWADVLRRARERDSLRIAMSRS